MAAPSLIFAYPGWFWAFPVVTIITVGLWFYSRRCTRKRLARFFSDKVAEEVLLKIDWGQKRIRYGVVASILCLFAVALARPLTGPKSDEGEASGADLVILLDVSKSMWVEDVEPTRLDAAKTSLVEWIQKQRSDRIGLILFAGEAFVQAPLTFDYNALSFVLRDAGPNSISAKGSNLPKAIETAAEMLNRNEVQSKILLIVSDGEVEGDVIAAARTAHQRDGVTIFTVGIGTAAGGKVPTFDKRKEDKPRSNSPPFARNEYGAEVTSRLESQTLRSIAAVGGGKYYEWSSSEPTFEVFREQSLMPLVEASRKIEAKDYDEWFQIPLGFAVLAMILEPLMCRRRNPATLEKRGVEVIQPETFSIRTGGHPAAVSVVLFLIVLATANATEPYMAATDQLFEAGKEEEAVATMRALAEENPSDPYLNYNLALTLVRAGQPEEARTIFEAVQGLASEPSLRAKAAFQIGTIHLQTAIELKDDRQAGLPMVRALESALNSYKVQNAISATKESKHNKLVAENELEAKLIAIGNERTRANTLKTLREALQAYERATELKSKHQPLVDAAKELLSAKLQDHADELDHKAQSEENQKIPDGKDGEKILLKVVEKRQEVLQNLHEADDLTPGKERILTAIKEQEVKMSDLLTRMANRKAEPHLREDEIFHASGEFRDLEAAGSQLAEALSLNPNNDEAKALSRQVEEALLDAHLDNGSLALKHFRKSEAPESQLEHAASAAREFTAALAMDPENQTAKDGLAEVKPQLADLYAAVGVGDIEKAKEMLGDFASGTMNAPEPAGSVPAEVSPEAGGQSAEGAEVPSESALRNSAATLERSLNNLGAAVSLKPDDAQHQKSLEEAESLMGEVRDQLAQLESAKGELAAGEGPGQGEDEGQNGPGGDPKSSPGGSMQSMSSLRGKPGAGGGGGGDSQRYWENYVRDW